MQIHRLAALLVLLGLALPTLALTLGQPQGATWVGRPLDLVIPVSVGEGERESLCPEAEVVQGSTRVDDKRVTVSLEPGARPGQTRMRVRSTVAIDEPLVHLTVRAGCDMKSVREFVLFADMPVEASTSDIAAPVIGRDASATQSGSSGPTRSFAGSTAGASGTASVRRASPSTTASRQPASERSAAQSRPAVARPPAVRRAVAPPPAASTPAVKSVPSGAAAPRAAVAALPTASAPAGGARLQLDALDATAARNPALGASASAALPNGADAAIAAAALAASAAANAEELQRANARMQALETTLATLREQSAQNQRLLLEMRNELAEARDSRYRNPLVYVLLLLLVLALIAIALLWRLARGNERSAWFGELPAKNEVLPAGATGTSESPLDGPASVVSAPSVPPTPAAALAVAALSPAFGANDQDGGHTLPPLADDDGTPARYVNTEELFDVQQQSDFFVSLGQHDQAIAVLSEHIAENPDTSALAYLDLLRIYHSLGRRDDYARVAREFERAFNADVPVFEQFAEVGQGLEHYRATLARIEAQWPEPATLNLIEELVFRKPGARGGDETFDLAAYRELLLLYSVAKEVIDPDSAPPSPVTPLSFADTHTVDLERTAPAPIEPFASAVTQPHTFDHGQGSGDAPSVALPSIYGDIDRGLVHDTVLVPEAPLEPRTVHAPLSGGKVLSEFDDTALETLPGALEPSASLPQSDASKVEPLADLELFDPTVEAEIAPKPTRRRR